MARTGRAESFLWGGLSLLAGLPFTGAAFSAFLLTKRLERGIPLFAIVLFALWYLTGFHGAGVTAVCAVTLVVCASRRISLMRTLCWTTGLTLLSGALLSLWFPGFMNISSAELESLREVYASAGMEAGMIDRIFELIVNYAPGIGAVQLTTGAILGVLFFRTLPGVKTLFPRLSGNVVLKMHWATAWIPIACLLVLARGRSSVVNPELIRAAGNLLLFMCLPYFIQGLQVSWKWARALPGMMMLLLISVIFATPLMAALVLLTGLLDTWFDFREKIENRIERINNEDSSD